jgi:hypothetical protein
MDELTNRVRTDRALMLVSTPLKGLGRHADAR